MLSGDNTDRWLEVVLVPVAVLVLVLMLVMVSVMVSVLASDIAHFSAYQGISILCGLPGHNRNRW